MHPQIILQKDLACLSKTKGKNSLSAISDSQKILKRMDTTTKEDSS
jgi:hypothetical protein